MGGKAHSMDLRERVMTAWDNGEGTAQEIAERFQISRNTIHKWDRRRRETGSLSPGKQGGARDMTHLRKVDARGEEFLHIVLTELPDSSMTELVAAYQEQWSVQMSPDAMRETVHRLGFRFKRGSYVHQQPSGPMS